MSDENAPLHPDATFPWVSPYMLRKANEYGVWTGSASWNTLVQHVEEGQPCGGFMTALLSNDLKEAFGRADLENTAAMKGWVMVMVNLMPIGSHGSHDHVVSWRAGLAALRERA